MENTANNVNQALFLEKLLETIYSCPSPRRVWESSKRVLDAKEVEIWKKRK